MKTIEIRKFAEEILLAETLEKKLQRTALPFADNRPGEPWRIAAPVRPEKLQFAPRRAAPKMPRPRGLTQSRNRAVAHHIMANHELQAVEVMAFILCAFPHAPAEFRQGVAKIIDDEQRHTRLHADRAEVLGVPFGSLPVNCYIWKKAQSFETPLDYLAGLPLTFEARNLDHTLEFETHFRKAGDRRSAAVMRIIHRDEIKHVRFGIEWLRKLKPPDQSDWDVYRTALKWPLRPSKARGESFQRDARLAAGLSQEFVDALELWADDESPPAN